jgi:hypothetical protein
MARLGRSKNSPFEVECIRQRPLHLVPGAMQSNIV